MPSKSSSGWPMYFLARDPRPGGRRLATCKAGDPFPYQDKRIIRGMGASFGVPDADERLWSALDYVTTVNVYSEDHRRSIVERGLNLQAVRQLLDFSGVESSPRRGRPSTRSAEA